MLKADANPWEMIDRAASQLGVKPATRKKWKQRGAVPHKWRLPIIQQSSGFVSAETFERLGAA